MAEIVIGRPELVDAMRTHEAEPAAGPDGAPAKHPARA